MPDPQPNQTPDMNQMIQEIIRGQRAILTQNQQLQERLSSLEGKPPPKPQASPPTDVERERLRERFFADFAEDPIGAFIKTKEIAKKEVREELAKDFDERLSKTVGNIEARNYARETLRQNPDLVGFEDKISNYVAYLDSHPEAQRMTQEQKIAQAVQWTKEWKAEVAKRVIEEQKAEERMRAGQAGPIPGAYRSAPEAGGPYKSEEEMKRERYELMQNMNSKRRTSLFRAA